MNSLLDPRVQILQQMLQQQQQQAPQQPIPQPPAQPMGQDQMGMGMGQQPQQDMMGGLEDFLMPGF